MCFGVSQRLRVHSLGFLPPFSFFRHILPRAELGSIGPRTTEGECLAEVACSDEDIPEDDEAMRGEAAVAPAAVWLRQQQQLQQQAK